MSFLFEEGSNKKAFGWMISLIFEEKRTNSQRMTALELLSRPTASEEGD
jgi:hypothetical protein